MKITKQARAALFVMLFVISILPGCGKNKNQDTPIVGGAPVIGLPGYPGGVATFAVTGQIYGSITGNFSGSLSNPTGSIAGGSAYSRTSGNGSVTLYLAPTAQGMANATAVVSLSQNTLTSCGGSVGYYGQPAQTLALANVYFQYQSVNPINNQLVYSVYVTLTNGCQFNI